MWHIHECMLKVVQSTDQQKVSSFLKVLAKINYNSYTKCILIHILQENLKSG